MFAKNDVIWGKMVVPAWNKMVGMFWQKQHDEAVV